MAAAKKSKSKRSETSKKKEEAAEKVRSALIASGDLIVRDDFEYSAAESHTKVATWVEALIEEIKDSKTPVRFVDACARVGIKYPEDIAPAMIALEKVGLVRRFEARSTTHPGRRKAAYLYVG